MLSWDQNLPLRRHAEMAPRLHKPQSNKTGWFRAKAAFCAGYKNPCDAPLRRMPVAPRNDAPPPH